MKEEEEDQNRKIRKAKRGGITKNEKGKGKIKIAKRGRTSKN